MDKVIGNHENYRQIGLIKLSVIENVRQNYFIAETIITRIVKF